MLKINHINKVYLLQNKYFVMEYNENKELVLNIKTGKEEILDNSILQGKKKYIYQDGNDYQEHIELENIDSIILRSNIELINKTNQKIVSSPYLIEIKDTKNSFLFIDPCLNQTYTRKNHYILKIYGNSKEDYIYKQNNSTRLFNILITLKLCNFLKPLIAIDEEDVI